MTYAQDLGLDVERFGSCLDSGAKAAVVRDAASSGDEIRVNGTLAFFVNGRLLSGAQPLEAFKTVIDAELGAR